MNCPHCGFPAQRNGKDRNGYQRYYCKACGKSSSDSPVLPMGRPMIGDAPLTPAEKMKRYRKKKKQENT